MSAVDATDSLPAAPVPTPAEFAWSLHQALAWSDGYVWMWPGPIDWWKKTVKTLDAAGKEASLPLPPEYLDALRLAHDAKVPEPPRDRKPNTYRVVSARTQEGWSDDGTFSDLWKTHEPICDLPEEWRFRIDPDEVGLRDGWHRPGLDDGGWETIRIREFWEAQGRSPYDGAAWYRLDFTAPDKVRFRWKLEGAEREWQEGGFQRVVGYGPLTPGSYRFQVLAANNDGEWNESGATLAFAIRPYYWETWWFRTGGAAAMVILPAPNSLTAFFIRAGSFTTALFIETEFAPAARTISMSSRLLIPPPTVSGIEITEETCLTQSSLVFLFSRVAAISSIASSSAPSF